MSEDWKQQVVIDNRGGAGGVVGTEIAARAAPDGYTFLVTTAAGMIINPLLNPTLPYGAKDFAPVSLLVVWRLHAGEDGAGHHREAECRARETACRTGHRCAPQA